MFFKLISRNSKRNRKENGLFFSSLLISIIAFYIILALSHQDVVIFLTKLESDAVNRLLSMIPVFYGMALFILFFLIYFASKYQLERRRHEFGVYLMMGMRCTRLFTLLLAEDLRNSVVSLAIGLPAAVLLSELISLITARLVGIGIVSHRISFSFLAFVWTAAGFLLIKFIAFLILSGKICRQEIGSLLVELPDGSKKQLSAWIYALAITAGMSLLATAYSMAISGKAWSRYEQMGITILLGLAGTLLFFWGLRVLIGLALKAGRGNRPLSVFNFRQIQETVMYRSGSLAVCSLLILASLCCFGAGVAITRYYGNSEPHVLDYTFHRTENERTAEDIKKALTAHQLDTCFDELFEIRVGLIRNGIDRTDRTAPFQTAPLMDALRMSPPSNDRDVLMNNLSYADYPYLISLSGYNQLLRAAGLPTITLESNEAAIYIDHDFCSAEKCRLLNSILETKLETRLNENICYLVGSVQTTNLITDRSITLSFALIVPDEVFESATLGNYSVYLNGILAKELTEHDSLMSAISDMNDKLDNTGLSYESYLKNMGRQLFYMVAAGYITIYLAIIFLIIANTVIGTQFLMGQQKSDRRYRTLVRLGATYETLCRSAKTQIHWYFGIPAAVAVFSSIFGVRALFTGILPSSVKSNLLEMMLISATMIFALCVIEWIYIIAVKRTSDRYLLKLMIPKREE